jgi:DNA-binding transcriptional regulator GbsR (MarR family)
MNENMQLSDSETSFILHWGEMGTRWGVNRTVAQIHALLYIAPRPLQAEEISEILSVARSTVSTGLRELQSWGLVRVVHVLGDRRDHFETLHDVWAMFRLVVDERKRREIDPTLDLLGELVSELKSNGDDSQARKRLEAMLDFFETISGFYEQIQRLPNETIVGALKTGDAVQRALKVLRR